MRITSAILMNQALDAMRANLSRLASSQGRVATGRQLLSPADDPAGQAAATRLAARLSQSEQWQRQARQARDYLETNDRLLARLNEIVAQASTLAVTGADGAKGPSERGAFAVEVNDLLEDVVNVANTLEDGRYVLGGQETLTPPLTVTRNAQGQITGATWNPRGVDGTLDIEIDAGVAVQANLGGTTVLGPSSAPTFLPALLITLRDRLAANDPDGVRTAIDSLTSAGTRLAAGVADTGARLRVVERTREDLESEHVSVQAALSAIVDADLARTAAELAQQEIAHQAALQAVAKAIQPSLLDFLR
jgi:flagellar hook-associated protein 3 FlgL